MVAIGGAAAAAGTPTAETSTAVSSNWAGYVAQPGQAAGARFASVSGSWTVPSVICVRGHASYSAVWVGLGGYQETASSLEQVGVDADCSHGGHPSYTSWYELLPAAPISLKLGIHPGDQIAASVTAKGHRVTLRLRNLTSSKRFNTSRRVRRIDLSSAEWIVEAPSECTSSEACSTLALSNFGDVLFTNASATARGHTGAISDPLWSATALELRQSARPHLEVPAAQTPALEVLATPTSPSLSDGSFAVGWREEAAQSEEPLAAVQREVGPADVKRARAARHREEPVGAPNKR
jgi:hypothetical protein